MAGLLLAMLLVATTSAFARTSPLSAFSEQVISTTHGVVTGRVSDRSGDALPGVNVTLAGAGLMSGRLVATTSRDGRYQILGVPPGDYTVHFEREGFEPASIDVQVGAGATATLDVVLHLPAVVESMTVEPRAGVIDRHTTAIALNFSASQLETLPGSRSLFSIIAATPGVKVTRFEVGGGTGEGSGLYGAYGTRGLNRPMVEGINVSNLVPFGFPLDYGAMQEVSVRLAAHGPDWDIPGVHVQLIAKSGGNQYRGTVYGSVEPRSWQAHNIDAEQQRRVAGTGQTLSREANRVWTYRDANADLGGFLARDRAWWYASVRDQDIQSRQVNVAIKPSRTELNNLTGKVTVRLFERHTLVAFAQGGRNLRPNRLDPFVLAADQPLNIPTAVAAGEEATSAQRSSGIVWKGEWNATLGQRLFAEARVGRFEVKRAVAPNGGGSRVENLDTLEIRGGGRRSTDLLWRTQFHAAITFVTNGPLGGHQVRLGSQVVHLQNESRRGETFPGGVVHLVRSGRPVELYQVMTPSASLSGVMGTAVHAGDAWQVSRRAVVNLGVRLDHYRSFLPEQLPPPGAQGQPATFPAVESVNEWTVAAPRIGVAFDLSDDGRTVAKASYGRYWLAAADLGPNVNPNTPDWWRHYQWQDLNGSGVWDPGEELQELGSRGGIATESIDPDLRPPWLDEVTGSIAHEFPGALGVRTGIVWRRHARPYARQDAFRPFSAFTQAVEIPDAGPDGLPGNSDDGPPIGGYGLADPDVTPANVLRNVSGANSRYLTWEVTAERRPRGRWWLSAGFAHTWTLEHANAYSGQVVRQNVYPLNPNDVINTADGGRHRFGTWTATVSGMVRAPWQIDVNPILRHQSGQPFGRTISARMNYGTVRVLAEPIGARRMDNLTVFDIRVQRPVYRSGSRRVSAFVEVFNLFNTNAEQNIIWASGPRFLQPLSVIPPRIAQIGVTAAF